MRTSWKSFAAVVVAAQLAFPGFAQFKTAPPGYHYEFPKDFFNHADFQTEWWYYTGNLEAADGRRFGFELTFFRSGITRDPSKTSTWDVRDLYFAHFAVSDLDRKTFFTPNEAIAPVRESRERINLNKKCGMAIGVSWARAASNSLRRLPTDF